MSIKKITTTTLLVLALTTFGVALAKQCDDFCQEDLDRALKGDKDLAGAKLEGADLHGRDFSGADFRGAEVEKVNFQGANLSNANFRNADLEEANLKGANIKGANFSGAELEYTIWVDGRICAEGSVGGCW